MQIISASMFTGRKHYGSKEMFVLLYYTSTLHLILENSTLNETTTVNELSRKGDFNDQKKTHIFLERNLGNVRKMHISNFFVPEKSFEAGILCQRT